MEKTNVIGENANETRYIELSLIDIPENARPHTPEDLESLAADMAKNKQLQEIVVVPGETGRFIVVAGVGRILAARKLNWEKIRCLVKESLSEFDKARITYAENEEREDPDPFYQASQLEKMMKAKGWSQNQLAQELGQGKAEVSRYCSLLNIAADVKQVFQRWNTPMSHITEVLRLKDTQEQVKLAQQCHDKDLSVRALKVMVDKILAGKPEAKAPKAKAQVADLVWKGEEIVINRHFKPTEGSAEDFIAWLGQALPAFIETKPAAKPHAAVAAAVA